MQNCFFMVNNKVHSNSTLLITEESVKEKNGNLNP